MRETYIFRNGQFVSKQTGEPMALDRNAAICAPRVISDIPEYRSPIDGKMITSRSHRRDDLARNGCIEWEPGIGKKAEFTNKKFAKKFGVSL
jgi:hypothetical protein